MQPLNIASFDELTLEDAKAITASGVREIEDAKWKFYQGDHWQDGAGWVGPMLDAGNPAAAEVKAEIERAFVFANVSREITDRHADAVTNREPRWGAVLGRVVVAREAMSEEEAGRIGEVDGLMTSWWDSTARCTYTDASGNLRACGVHELLQQVARRYAATGRAYLRIFIPPAYVKDGTLPKKGLAEALDRVYVEMCEPQSGATHIDRCRMQRVGVYLWAEGEKEFVETTYIAEDGSTVLRQIVDEKGDGVGGFYRGSAFQGSAGGSQGHRGLGDLTSGGLAQAGGLAQGSFASSGFAAGNSVTGGLAPVGLASGSLDSGGSASGGSASGGSASGGSASARAASSSPGASDSASGGPGSVARGSAKKAGVAPSFWLGGNLLHFEASGDGLLSDSLIAQQKDLNRTLTMGGRAMNLAGFPERVLFDVQLDGEYVDDPQNPGRKKFVPHAPTLGAASINNFTGIEYADEEGRTRRTTPSYQRLDPPGTRIFDEAVAAAARRMRDEAGQSHIEMSSDAAASGRSREQARWEFVQSLAGTVSVVNSAGRWLLTTVFLLALATSTEDAARFEGLKFEFACRVDPGPISPAERAEDRNQVQARLLSRETAMTRGGVDDVDAEWGRIGAEDGDSLTAMEQRARITQVLSAAGAGIQAAAEVAGFDEEQAERLARADFVEGFGSIEAEERRGAPGEDESAGAAAEDAAAVDEDAESEGSDSGGSDSGGSESGSSEAEAVESGLSANGRGESERGNVSRG